MGIYERYIFPRLSEPTLASRAVGEHRAAVLRDVGGDVLEIGFGSGTNLPHFSAAVTKLTAIEPSGGMTALGQERIAAWPGTLDLQQLEGEQLPFDDAAFDSVVITLTLCTVRDVDQVLAETHRVLRPGGRVHFIEHVAAKTPRARAWQDRLNGLWRIIGCGCNLNRDIEAAYLRAGFRFQRLEHVTMPGPKLMEPLFPAIRGVATHGA